MLLLFIYLIDVLTNAQGALIYSHGMVMLSDGNTMLLNEYHGIFFVSVVSLQCSVLTGGLLTSQKACS